MEHSTSEGPTFEARFSVLAAVGYRVAYRLSGDRSEAEDLAQEALARAYVSWRRVWAYDEAWVARVTTNLAVGRWRRRRLERDPSRQGGEPHHPSHAVDALDRVELVSALRSLPRRQREVVVLRYLADLSEADVSAALRCSPGTVKQHAHRGLASLRRHLGIAAPRGAGAPQAKEDADVRAAR